MKQINKRLFTVLMMLLGSVAFSQGFPPPPPPPPPGFPIDGGLFVLALVGAFYGVKKLKK